MKKLAFAGTLIVALTFAAEANAGGWAGSRYDKSNCTYNKESNILYCEARFRGSAEQTTAFVYVSDSECASGTRVVERTGTLVETFRGWGYFTGHVPLSKNEIVGDEDSFEFTWENFTDVDQGCLV
jgi:hypothetical protein